MWAVVTGAGFVPAGFLAVAKPQGTRTSKGSLPNQVEEEKLATPGKRPLKEEEE